MSSDATSQNLELMGNASSQGYDVVIVCTSNPQQEQWWQDRLTNVRGQVLPKDCVVVAVHEDWEGGAGNALGTLYAFEKAAKKAHELFNYDIMQHLQDKTNPASVALYHTAGKGTRLAPLPGAENNNKPGVKLPAVVQVNTSGGQEEHNMTILEAVIKQTSPYAAPRKARLSVYWGDQVFIPNVSASYVPSAHADILCQLGPMMTAEEWVERGLDKYGLIVVNKTDEAAQVEKVSHATATSLLKDFGEIKSVGVSLGSFSISHQLLSGFLSLHEDELKAKNSKLDADPHWWMPLTLSRASYVDLMTSKATAADVAESHFDRMAQFKAKFLESESGKQFGHFFGAVNVGTGCYWWDYGQLKLYSTNNKLASAPSEEAACVRKFFGLPDVDAKGSVCVNTKMGPDSTAERSVLSQVCVKGSVDVSDSLIVGVTAKSIKGRGCVLYNVVDDTEEGIVMEDGEVRADIFFADGRKVTMRTNLSLDSGKKWSEKLQNNNFSFEEMYTANMDENVTAAMLQAQTAHADAASKHQ